MPNRYRRRGGILPPRRHPALRAAQPDRRRRLTPADILAAFDVEVRRASPTPDPAYRFEERHDAWRLIGPTPEAGDNTVTFVGAGAAALPEAIDRTVADYAARGHAVEWKVYGHDRPDPAPALLARGFAAQESETLLVLDVAAGTVPVRALPGVDIGRLADDAPLDQLAGVRAAVDGEAPDWLVAALTRERNFDPRGLSVWQARAGGAAVAHAWVRYVAGSRFASFWGGATHPDWRGHGIYTQLVAHRVQEARTRGARFVYVEARETSRPILERLGFAALTQVSGYVWAPPAGSG